MTFGGDTWRIRCGCPRSVSRGTRLAPKEHERESSSGRQRTEVQRVEELSEVKFSRDRRPIVRDPSRGAPGRRLYEG